jgi:DNA-binding winged helix-turn-helix (wHTH) protein
MKSHLKKIGLPLAVLLACLLAVQGMSLASKPDASADRQFSQKVNLAIRQAADRLFDLAGDKTSTIPPVEEISPGEFLLRLENNFAYDSLPALLDAALAQLDIDEPYYVTVNNCLNNLLMLGYTQEAVKEGQVACGGRVQTAGCYNLTVVFPNRREGTDNNAWAWIALALGAAAAFAAGYFYKKTKNKEALGEAAIAAASPEASVPLPQATNNQLLRFANTEFDPTNQYVQIGDTRQPLTFREAKLLHFFLQHQNQVVERDAIMAAVWEDEGIIVGRSLDVFVSRLRKILQKDTAVKIANVHGVGYRLEVAG